MWEFYLASSELAFRYGGLMVFQAQLARRLDSVPLTRDYMYERERERSRIATVRQLTPVKGRRGNFLGCHFDPMRTMTRVTHWQSGS
jgi:cyclopropane-fatty-acyl-phospholipid synthase